MYSKSIVILQSVEPLRLPECIDLRLARDHHLLCHVVDLRTWPVVHHRIREHKVDVALELKRVGYEPILNARLDRLEVHRSLDDIVVVWGFGFFDGIVENVAVTVLGDRTVKHADDVLELFGDDRCFGVRAFAALFDCLTWA